MSNGANCGCCACLSAASPHLEIENRPGLSALSYRIGTYATLYEAMLRRLTVPQNGETAGYSLHALTTREPDDPAIAFLDAWAIVGDVLTFYQERIANEGYLRTATERRSILELGRLVGYKLKPGVSASVYLAYTLEDNAKTVIPKGSKSQTIPGDNEQPQTFETSEDVEARGVWNALKPRLRKPLEITLETVLIINTVWIQGAATRLSANEPLLFVFKTAQRKRYALRTVASVTADHENDRLEVQLAPVSQYFLNVYAAAMMTPANQNPDAAPEAALAVVSTKKKKKAATPAVTDGSAITTTAMSSTTPPLSLVDLIIEQLLLGASAKALQNLAIAGQLPDGPLRKQLFPTGSSTPTGDNTVTPSWSLNTIVKQLTRRTSIAPASQWQFARDLNTSLKASSDVLPRLTATFLPRAGNALYTALAFATTGSRPFAQFESVHVLRRRAAVFGYNAPTVLFEERGDVKGLPVPTPVTEADNELYLDTPDEAVKRDSYVVVQRLDTIKEIAEPLLAVRVATDVQNTPRTAYSITGKSTRLVLDQPWTSFSVVDDKNTIDDMAANLRIIRSASVLVESEPLLLAQQPVVRDIGLAADENNERGESETRIELDTVIEGLTPGRFVIVSGERADTPGTTGVIASELVMIENIELVSDAGPGGTPYSVLTLAPEGLQYRYRRGTVRIYANIVKATQGESRAQILGGGDASRKMQTFQLQHAPLTWVSAPTISGVQSTLAVRVNDVLWYETDAFIGAAADARVFVTKTANDGKVSVIFGNGREGALLPTGTDNVRATYRSGIGYAGNARPRQIATAISRPLGVKDVINPLAATGGVDPESAEDGRRNIPVSLQAMGRVVSVRDFADFARTFAGISKASAVALSDGRRRVIHLTVGGTRDVDVDVNSDLYRNLVESLRKYGDPYQPFIVEPREKMVMAGSAKVRVHPDYLWTDVAPRIRAKLLDVFSYDRRELGQVLFPSEVVAAIQNVPGVAYVDLDTLGSISQTDILDLSDQPKIEGFLEHEITYVEAIVPRLAKVDETTGEIVPAQIAYLPPNLAELFVLTEITDEP